MHSKREELEHLVKKFNDVKKQITRTNASKRPIKIKIREYLIIQYWNDILKAVNEYEQETDYDESYAFFTLTNSYYSLKECLTILNSQANVGDKHEFIVQSTITPREQAIVSKIINENKNEISEVTFDKFEEELDTVTVDPDSNNSTVDPNKMPQTAEEFFRLASKVVDTKFDGDPANLEAFIEQVELLEPMVEAQNKSHLIKFIGTKLVGKARRALPDKPSEVSQIITALRNEIKYEPSRVIEGKIIALRLDKKNNTKFSEQANKLAEQLRESLIFEGHTKDKAQEMTIRKTVDLCYKLARSETVKAVLGAKAFTTPSEVIYKFVEQTDTARQDYFANKNQNGQGSRAARGNNRSRGNYRNNFQRNSNNFNQNRNQNQNRGNYNNGRGYRGNRQYRGNNSNQNNNRSGQVLRIMGPSENLAGPSQEGRALPAPSSGHNVQFELMN